MRREGYRHPKTLDLADRLDISRPHAIGILEVLWDFAADNAPRGDIGKWSDGAIARGCDWPGDARAFVAALVESRWLDRCPQHRLVIHHLADHAPNWWHQKVKEIGGFLTAEPGAEGGAEPPVEPPAEPGAEGGDILLCSSLLTSPHLNSPQEGERAAPPARSKRASSSPFVPPSEEEVKAYWIAEKIAGDPAKFFDYFTANGWKTGKNAMKEWKPAARNWGRNEGNFGGSSNGQRNGTADARVRPSDGKLDRYEKKTLRPNAAGAGGEPEKASDP